MFAFIRKHWVAYLIGAAVAVVLGFGVSYVLGVKWSTPEETLTIHWTRTRRPTLNQPTPVHPQSSIQRPLLMLTL